MCSDAQTRRDNKTIHICEMTYIEMGGSMCLTVYTHLNICGVPNVYVFAHSPNIDLTLGRPVEGSYFACIELICLSGLTVDALAYTGLEYIGTYSLDQKMWCLCRWRFLPFPVVSFCCGCVC